MAKTDNLTDFLTDIADTIRAKKGTTALINPQDFSSEISSIETGTSKLPSVIDGSIEVLNEEDFGNATKIRYNAFNSCSKLREVHIPETITIVEGSAFNGSNNSNGAEVYYNGTFKRVDGNFGSFKTEENKITYYKLNDNPYAICDKNSYSSEDTETDININENCEYISSLSLSPSITSINIPSSVKSIDQLHSSTITSLVIPDSVQYIYYFGVDSLTTITLGSGLKHIENYCLSNAPITSITYTGTVEQWNKIELPNIWGFTQEIDVVCSDGTVKINAPKQITIKLINTGTQTVDFTPALSGPFNGWGATPMTQDGNTYTATVTGPSPLAFQINNNGNWNKQINNNDQPFSSTTDCTVTANFDNFPEAEWSILYGTLTEGV